MILIFGGTTEGKLAAKTCDVAGKEFYYSTKTSVKNFEIANGKFVEGAMQVADIVNFCRTKNIGLIINAAHPFAENLHTNIAMAAEQIHLPVIRLERRYPKVKCTENVSFFDNFDALLETLLKNPQKKLLALSGVNTIGKLKKYWQNHYTIFRILNRKISIDEATNQGLPLSQIIYYDKNSNDEELLQSLEPSAIITKESGDSGGYAEKLSAAKKLNIPVFVVKRPALSPDFINVQGEHGLRKQIEMCLPNFFDLKTGYTTGSCATAAAKSAFATLVTGEINSAIRFQLPNGESVRMEVKDTVVENNRVCCTVVKDAGDDPDVTHLADIQATVWLSDEHSGIKFRGGKGVGVVTLPGLGIDIGEPAINATPRKMMLNEIRKIKRHFPEQWYPLRRKGIVVEISVPAGEKLAKSTFNPRIGIEGGISIIGTSGVVKPFSSAAFIASIRKEMQVAKAMNSERIVLNSGAKSEKYIKAQYPDLPAQAFIHYGNFIGESVKTAEEIGVKRVSIGVMIGKAVKLADGHLDTHSKKVVMNKEFIVDLAVQSACKEQTLAEIRNINLARQLWEIIDNEAFFQLLADKCWAHCKPLLPSGELELLLLDNSGERIFRSRKS